MIITTGNSSGLWGLRSATAAEVAWLDALSEALPIGGELGYCGSDYADDGTTVTAVYLNVGGLVRANRIFDSPFGKYAGGDNLVLVATDPSQAHYLTDIRATCFFSAFTYLGRAADEAGDIWLFGSGRCELCSGLLATLPDFVSSVCRTCATNCPHTFEPGIIQGGGLTERLGEVCSRCHAGRGLPDDFDLTDREHRLRLVRARVGISAVIDRNTGEITRADDD